MLIICIVIAVVFIICVAIMIAATLLSRKAWGDREKSSPFECGFDPNGSARLPFSLRFFLIAIIFLIFDVEVTLLLPLVSSINFSSPIHWIFTGSIFLLILILGLYHEWNQGALEWAN
uniref:NADH-ubiquinone oxidoreductase chain 3 n=1 Tax=Rhynchocinetes durbanensis TaxID=516932 RepID=A0A109YEV1_9EUCA|nr:NADH dehydrogenase subunit 3 [Rhynchocinetes durbanensis]AMA20512.1 NADH dehydrogenase subunit 3 [Rhynchocinetes durbanensis]